MTILTPPGWEQNAGTVYTAQMMRYYTNTLLNGNSAGSLIPRGGINYGLGNGCTVQEDSPSPSMNVRVLNGMGVVPGTENSLQGGYQFMNDGTVTVALDAAHATLGRIDLIVVRVRDSAYSGGTNDVTIEKVTGTPSGSPAIPSAPSNSLILAQISVGAAVTTIPNSVITDRRWPLNGKWMVRKTADEFVISSTTFQNDDILKIPCRQPDTAWMVTGFILFDTSTAADIKLQFTVPSGADFRYGVASPGDTASSSSIQTGVWAGRFATSTHTMGGIGTSNYLAAHLSGCLTVGSTLGDAQLQWAQNTSDASNTRITLGSWLYAELIQ